MARVNPSICCLILGLVFGLFPQVSASSPPTEESALVGTVWVLESLYSRPIRERTQITLDLSDSAFAGYSGCNRYGGAYQATDGEFTIVSYQMTMLGCAQEALRQEAAYAVALSRATRYRASGNRLELAGGKGHTLLVFSKKVGLAQWPGLRTADK